MSTLWDLLIKPIAEAFGRPRPARAKRARPAPRRRPAPKAPTTRPRTPARERYEQIAAEMLTRYGVKVRKWRKSMSGVAWENTYNDGTVKRFLESPRPRSPMSMAIFLHEIGHHAIGFNTYKPRCLEEYHAWKFSLDRMRELGVPVTDRVQLRVRRSLEYAVGKAKRRGIRELPPELAAYSRPGRR